VKLKLLLIGALLVPTVAFADSRQPCTYMRSLGRSICIIKPSSRQIRGRNYIAPRVYTNKNIRKFIPRNTIRKSLGVVSRVLNRREIRQSVKMMKKDMEQVKADIKEAQRKYSESRLGK